MTTPRPSRCRSAILACIYWATCIGSSSFAAGVAKKSFDLAAGEADSALKQLSIQAGVEVIYSSRLTRNVTTNRVKGDFTAKEAIDLLLAGTGLVSAEDAKSGSLTVRKQTSEESKNDTKATQDAAGVAGSESSKKTR